MSVQAGSAGKIAQIVTATFTASADGSTQIPVDNSIPQSGEGTEFMTISITPTNASSTLIVRACAFAGMTTAARYLAMALFRDSGADAIGVTGTFHGDTNASNSMSLEVPVAAGSTSATTFKIRIGANSTGTVTFNGANSSRLYGAIPTSSMSVMEVLP